MPAAEARRTGATRASCPANTNRPVATVFKTRHGKILCGDASLYLPKVSDRSLDLVVTSPPFGLIRPKKYGNVHADKYTDWFRPYAEHFHRVLKDSGSLVLDIGGVWTQGEPTRHLYHFKMLIMLCEEYGFKLAQDFYWWNPAKLPTPAEWVTVRRIRAKDAVNTVWWLSKTPWPKASNRRVLQPYSESMRTLLSNGYKPRLRPSGHDISQQFGTDNGGAIPPNLLAIANTGSNSQYLRYCRTHNIEPHPARFPDELPEFFVRMLTDEGDQVLDPFAGSCVTGAVCERLRRRWTCVELHEPYVRGALGRFPDMNATVDPGDRCRALARSVPYFKLPRVDALWNGRTTDKIPKNGGKAGRPSRSTAKRSPSGSTPRSS